MGELAAVQLVRKRKQLQNLLQEVKTLVEMKELAAEGVQSYEYNPQGLTIEEFYEIYYQKCELLN